MHDLFDHSVMDISWYVQGMRRHIMLYAKFKIYGELIKNFSWELYNVNKRS